MKKDNFEPVSPTKIVTRAKNGRVIRVRSLINDKSTIDQSFRDDVNMDRIATHYFKTGELTHRARTEGVYGDFTGAEYRDLGTAIDKIEHAKYVFETLPARVREKMGNDFSRAPEFLANPDNHQFLVEHGVYEAPKPSHAEQTVSELRSLNKALSSKKPATPKSPPSGEDS